MSVTQDIIFGALSLRWIQFASVFRCARSSFLFFMYGIWPYFSDLALELSFAMADREHFCEDKSYLFL